MLKLREQKGAFAPFVAILIVLLILVVGLVVDLGHIHNVRIELQRAVDASALAGAGQLLGDAGQNARAIAAAEAMAEQNNVDAVNVSVSDDNVIATVGSWNEQDLDLPAEERYEEDGDPTNAVRVEATRAVDYWFFFLLPGTDVTASAIAVNRFEEETIPIALVSCIPTGGGKLNIASPGLSVCDVTTYEFKSDNADTSAWTSLTFSPPNKTQIEQFLTEDGRDLFNEVVYGTNNISHDGIENSDVYTNDRVLPVQTYDKAEQRGCRYNDGTSISCGLGEDLSLDTESIIHIREADPDKVPAQAEADPLAYDPLPRWYHFDDPAGSYDPYEDAFTRVWTMDGHLVQAETESATEYQTRLENLFNETIDAVEPTKYRPFGLNDHRFKNLIEEKGGTYRADYNEALRYAGYPPVYVNNGTIPPALDTFLDRIANKDTQTFDGNVSFDHEPFDIGNESNSGGRGYTVQLTIPVIFAGDCETWKAISHDTDKHSLYYVGTANFLVTRAWKSNKCFEQSTTPLTVTNWTHSDNDLGCAASDFEPPLAAGDDGETFECIGGKPIGSALEGVIRPPTRGANAQAGIRKVYLVK